MSDGTPVNWQIIEPNWPYVSSPETKHGDFPVNAWFFRGFPMKDCDFPTKKTSSNLHLSRISHGFRGDFRGQDAIAHAFLTELGLRESDTVTESQFIEKMAPWQQSTENHGLE
jgi:hypothetical protein